MNKTEAELIEKAGMDYHVSCKFINRAEEYDVIIDEVAQFKSFEAAKHAMKAFIIEKQHGLYENKDFVLPELFVEIKEADSVSSQQDEGQSSLKIDNKNNLIDYPTILVFTTGRNVCKIQNGNITHFSQAIDYSDLEPGERPIYICGIKNYTGYLIIGFENGKVGKISMDSFKTEFNRKKLKNAYNSENRMVYIQHIKEDIDLIAISSIDKVVVFNTSQINAVGSKTTKGVQVMKSKDMSRMVKVKKLNQVNLEDPEYYRKSEGLNAVGFYLKEGDEIV